MIRIGDVTDVQPESQVVFLSGIPNIDGEDTIFFPDRQTQYVWFNAHRAPALNGRAAVYTNINIMRGTLVANFDAETIMNNSNYLMIRNREKWYYCFLIGVVQNSVNSSTVSFKVDALQTYYFDYGIIQAYIEREHVTNDTVENIYNRYNAVTDELECGDYVVDERVQLSQTGYSVVVWASQNTSGAQTSSVNYGLYNGAAPHRINSQNYSSANDFGNAVNSYLNQLTEAGAANSILNICQVPNTFFGSNPHTLSIDKPTSVGGYTPRNKILLGQPYTFVVAGTNCGSSIDLSFELAYSNGYDIQCAIYYMLSPQPQAILIPMNYRGTKYDADDAITMDNYPQCAYATDSYKAWLALNSNQLLAGRQNIYSSAAVNQQIAANNRNASAFGLLGNAVGAIGSLLTGNVGGVIANVGGAIGGAVNIDTQYNNANLANQNSKENAIRSLNAKITDASKMPFTPTAGSGGNAPFQLKFFDIDGAGMFPIADFFLERRSIKRAQAQRLDQYYDMYGYRTNRLGIPHEDHRERYWYTKTADITLSGSGIPYPYFNEIKARYNAGIRFWRYSGLVGNYALLNRTTLEADPDKLWEPIHWDAEGVKDNVKE